MTEPTPSPKPNPTAPTLPSQGLNGGSSSTPSCAPTLDPGAGAPMAMPIPTVPGYEVFEELGRGGMGVVYRARHEKLNRFVALKMILAGGHASPSDLKRFLAEAEAVAALQHTNIVQIFEVGQDKGLPYLVLEVVPGGSLSRKCSAGPLPAAEAAKLVSELARGIAYAHSRGVIHRDLKPDNVLIAETGIPKISDFGLAKRLEDASGTTQTGAILGTPSYMAPEQANKAKDVGRAADMYSLGAILYRLLTGRPPFLAATPLETVMQVVSDDPAPPTQLQSRIPRDLETICLKCLQKDPAKRYASADALADDLERFLRNEPILARPVGPLERASKWIRRNPLVAGLLTAVMMSLAIGTTVSYVKYLDADTQRRRAETNERDADSQRKRAEFNESKATEQEKLAKGALAESETILTALIDDLLEPIGRNGSQSDPVEAQALAKVANFKNVNTRIRFLETGLKSPESTKRLALRADVVLQAVVGLDRRQKDLVEKILLERWRTEDATPEMHRACIDLGVTLPIDDAEFTSKAVQELIDASGKAKSSSELNSCANRLLRLLPRLNQPDASKLAATAAANFVRQVLSAPEADAFTWEAEAYVKLVNLVSAEDLAAVTSVISSEIGKSDLAFGKLDSVLSISEAVVNRMDPAAKPQFAINTLDGLVNAITNRRDSLFSGMDAGNKIESRIQVFSGLIGKRERSDLSRRIVERIKTCESLRNLRSMSSLLSDLASTPPSMEDSAQLQVAKSRMSELLKRANDFELIQFVPMFAMPESRSGGLQRLHMSADEALMLAETVIGMSGMSRQKEFAFIKPLYGSMLVSKLDEAGVRQIRTSLERQLAASPKPSDSAALETLALVADMRDKVLKHRPLGLVNFLNQIDRANPQESAMTLPLAAFAGRGSGNATLNPTTSQVMAGTFLEILSSEAEGREFESVTRELATILPTEKDPFKQAILLDALTNLTKKLPAEHWPDDIASPSQLVLPLLTKVSPEHLGSLIQILAQSVETMSGEEVLEVMGKLGPFIVKLTGSSALKGASEVLRVAAKKGKRSEAKPMAELVAHAAMQEITKAGDVSADLIEAISNILQFLDRSRASDISLRALDAWQKSAALRILKLKEPDFAPLFASLSLEELVHILKLPSSNEVRRSLALKQLAKIAGREFVTVWDFVGWAEKEHPELDLKSPPKSPVAGQ